MGEIILMPSLELQADNRTKLEKDFSEIAIHLCLTDHVEAEDQVVSGSISINWLSNLCKILA